MPFKVDTPKTKGINEPYTFMLKLIGKETSSSKQSLKLIKVDEGKCEDDIGIFSLLGAFCFGIKVMGVTFVIDVMVPRVRIMHQEHCIELSPTILYPLALMSQWIA
jgi:hypothetical protein